MSPARTKRPLRVLRQFAPLVPCVYGDASWPLGSSGCGRRFVEQVDGHALRTMGVTNQRKLSAPPGWVLLGDSKVSPRRPPDCGRIFT